MGLYINLEKAREMVAAAVAERGEDYVYKSVAGQGCAYVHPTLDGAEPGCGVGLALIRAGVPTESFEKLNINVGCGAHGALMALEHAELIDGFTNEGYHYLASFQDAQDSRESWGYAQAAAERVVKLL